MKKKVLYLVLCLTIALSIVVGATVPAFAAEEGAGDVKVAVQMYNFLVGGDLFDAEAGVEADKDTVVAALTEVAAMGYDGVEFANLFPGTQFYGIDPAELKGIMEELGLGIAGTHYHANWLSTDEDIDAVIEANVAVGSKRIIFAYSVPEEGQSNEDWLAYINGIVDNMKARVAEAGADIEVLYHNHGDEFMPMSDEDDSFVMDNITSDFYEIDLYWASRGLGNTEAAVEWANNNADKIHLLHIKDGDLTTDFSEAGAVMPWGGGEMPLQEFVDVARNSTGIEWVVVENDTPAGHDGHNALEDAKESIDYIKENIDLTRAA